MSFSHSLTAHRRALIATVVGAAISAALLPHVALAQGGMGGGFGSPGGMGGRGRHGPGGSSNASAPNVSKHFEDMGSLKDALKHVDGLDKDQKNGFDDIEHSYDSRFKSMGHDAQHIVDSAHAAHERPDRPQLDSLRQQARRLRDEELGAARALLATDAQRGRFDSNVAQMRADEAKREEEMQERLGPGGGPGGSRGAPGSF